jgi:hypothetical protein|tara:strand:- start:1360 stop:1533 length:174 start_codon:yes stop_codon:yes gene_type:complete
MLHDIFLLPITVGQYLLSVILWYLIFSFIIQSDRYYDTKDWLEEKYADYKEKKNAKS